MFKSVFKSIRVALGLQKHSAGKSSNFTPQFEELEPIIAPVTIWRVTTLADDGVGSLRSALDTTVNFTLQDYDVIRLEVPLRVGNNATADQFQGIIRLLTPITCDKSVTIEGQPIYDPEFARSAPRLRIPFPNFYSITIDGSRDLEGANPHQGLIFSNPNAAVSATISNLSFQGCNAGTSNGGAISVTGSLTLTSCHFFGNRAAMGGAVNISPYDNNCNVQIDSSDFTVNVAISEGGGVINGAGGAINIGAIGANDAQAAATIIIRNSAFEDNRSNAHGGAIRDAGDFHELTVSDCVFERNVAGQDGGGIYAVGKTLSVSRGKFERNRASISGTGKGGAIHWQPTWVNTVVSDSLTITDVEFTTNSADNGGAVYVRAWTDRSTVSEVISGCLFNDNRAGGGLYVDNWTAATGFANLFVGNSTFSANHAHTNGGAIALFQSGSNDGGTADFVSLTVYGNRAGGEGGGIYLEITGYDPTVRNSIIAGNRAQWGNDVFGTVVSQSYNLVANSDDSAGWLNCPGGDLFGNSATPVVPGLDPAGLQNNGGPTRTIAVPSTSLAYQTGDPGLQTIGGADHVLRRDQRGLLRNGAAMVTVGAYDPGNRGNAANHAPAGVNNTVTTLEDTVFVFAPSDFGFTDANDSPAHSFTAVKITSLPDYGILMDDGLPVNVDQFISVGDIDEGGLVYFPNLGQCDISFSSFGFKVQDNGGTANSGVDLDATARTMTIDVTSVNDAPVGTGNTVATLKNTAYVFAPGDFGFTDPGETSANSLNAVKIVTLPAAGTLTNNGNAVSANDVVSYSNINSGLLVFTPATDATGVGYASLTFKVQDNGGTSNGGVDLDETARTMTFNVFDTGWVNHAPVGTNNTITALENTPYVLDAADFGFTDPNESSANNFLSVQITSLPGAGTLTDNGIAVSANSFISVSHIDDGLVIYMPGTNGYGTSYASFGFKVRDDGGTDNSGANTDTTARTMTINVTQNNQAPTGADNTVTTLENAAYTFAPADFGFDDPVDSDSFAGVVITSLPMFGTLTNDGVEVEADDLVSYSDIDDDLLVFTPEENISGAPYDAFFFQVKDDGGTSNGGVDVDPNPKIMTVNVTWVNQAPQGTSNTVLTGKNTAYTFLASDFGFSDPDDAPGNWFEAVKITSLPSVGSLTNDGNAVSANDFVSLDDIFAGNLVFTPATDATGLPYASFNFKVQDDGGTANSGTDLDGTARTMTIDVAYPWVSGLSQNSGPTAGGVYSITITGLGFTGASAVKFGTTNATSYTVNSDTSISATVPGSSRQTVHVTVTTSNGTSPTSAADEFTYINGAPTGTNKTVTAYEDTDFVFQASDFGFADLSDSPYDNFWRVLITTLPAAGTLTLDGNAVTAGQYITKADIDSGKLKFRAATDAYGTNYASFSFKVQDDGGTACGGIDLDTTARLMTIDVMQGL